MKNKKRDNKYLKISLITVAVIIILLVGAYFLDKQVKKSSSEKEQNAFNQGYLYGYNLGYTEAVSQLMDASDTCQPFPVYLGEEVRTLMALECFTD